MAQWYRVSLVPTRALVNEGHALDGRALDSPSALDDATQDPVFNPRCRHDSASVFLSLPIDRWEEEGVGSVSCATADGAMMRITTRESRRRSHILYFCYSIHRMSVFCLYIGTFFGTFSGRGRERRARRGARSRWVGRSSSRDEGCLLVAFRRVRSRRTHRRRRISRGAPSIIDSSIHPSWRRSRWRSSASSVRARLGKRTRWSAVSSRLEARAREAR